MYLVEQWHMLYLFLYKLNLSGQLFQTNRIYRAEQCASKLRSYYKFDP